MNESVFLSINGTNIEQQQQQQKYSNYIQPQLPSISTMSFDNNPTATTTSMQNDVDLNIVLETIYHNYRNGFEILRQIIQSIRVMNSMKFNHNDDNDKYDNSGNNNNERFNHYEMIMEQVEKNVYTLQLQYDQFEQQQQQQYGQQQPINIDMTTTDATLYHHCMQQPPYNYWSNDLNQSLSTAAATTATMDLNWFDYDATINLSASDIINENVVDIPIVDHQSDGISTTVTAEPTSSSLNQQDNWNDLNVIYSDIASHFTLVDPSSTTSTSTSSKIEQSIVDDQQSMVQIDYQLSNIVDTQNTELMENYYNNDQQMESNAIDQQYFNLHNHNNDEQLLNLNNNDNNNTIVDTTIDHQLDTNLFSGQSSSTII
ncbi:hypothetical protein DERF_004494 [Dermatophagoides farinae]|uniref:Uncharacterized protein n=1 Tax=Dermatophagoides farinae TaxID=6954 RepID=A0A922I3D4_DERFA|nr:hypothetical protein DERF_004494 [Dermatophagoides farinae]